MAINPHDHSPAATFDQEMQIEPPAEALTFQGQFLMALYSDEQKQKLYGYMGTSGGNYTIGVAKKDALKINKYQYYAITCYQYGNRYLSVSTFAYVGWYLWNGATGWTQQPNGLFTSVWNGQNLSSRAPAGDYLFAWNPYSPLFVNPEAA